MSRSSAGSEGVFVVNHRVSYLALLLLMMSAVLPLTKEVFGVIIYTPYVTFVCYLLLTISVWLLRPKRIIKRKEEWAFVLAPLFIVIAALGSGAPGDSIANSSPAIYAALLYIVVRYYLQIGLLKSKDIQSIALFIFSFLSFIAVLQFLLKEQVGQISSYFGESSSDVALVKDGQLRISSTFGNPNVFVQVYSIYGAIVVAKYINCFGAPRIKLALLISALNLFVVLTSLSRSGLVFTLVLQSMIYTYWAMNNGMREFKSRIAIILLLIVVAIASGLIILQMSLMDGVERVLDTNDSGRLETYIGAIRLLQDPLVSIIGVGSGQFFEESAKHGIYYSYKSWLDASELNSSVHNWTLMVASENGIIVLFLYVYSIYKTIKRGWSMRKVERGWLGVTLAMCLLSLYLTALQLGTTGTTPWILTLVAVLFAWIHREYDNYLFSISNNRKKSS